MAEHSEINGDSQWLKEKTEPGVSNKGTQSLPPKEWGVGLEHRGCEQQSDRRAGNGRQEPGSLDMGESQSGSSGLKKPQQGANIPSPEGSVPVTSGLFFPESAVSTYPVSSRQ